MYSFLRFILLFKGIFLPVSMTTTISRLLSIHFHIDIESEFFKSSLCALIVYCSLTWKTLWTNGCLVSILFRCQSWYSYDKSSVHLIIGTSWSNIQTEVSPMIPVTSGSLVSSTGSSTSVWKSGHRVSSWASSFSWKGTTSPFLDNLLGIYYSI